MTSDINPGRTRCHSSRESQKDISSREAKEGRVEIARRWFLTPASCFSTNLLPASTQSLSKISRELLSLRNKKLGILITDHNVRETLQTIDRAYIICEGKILKSGSAEFLASDPEARKIYLGEKFKLN